MPPLQLGEGGGLSNADIAAAEEAAAFARLHNMPIEMVIRAGHEAILRRLVAKAQAGSITHQEAAILRNMLRDNGMTLGIAPSASAGPGPGKQQDLPDLPDYPNH